MKWVLGCCVLLALTMVGGWQAVSSVPGNPADGLRQAVPQPTLVAADSSPHENDGVIQGRPDLGLPGHRGTSYSFDRPGSWIQVPPDPMLNPGWDDFLLIGWVNFTVEPVRRDTFDIVRKGLSWTAGGDYKLEIVRDGRVRCMAVDHKGRIGRVVGPLYSVADGEWHRIGCARTDNMLSVIVDDTVTSKEVDLGKIDNAMSLSIGSKYGQEDSPQGRIDKVLLYIAPAASETTEPASEPRARMKQLRSHPVGVWLLDESPSEDPDY